MAKLGTYVLGAVTQLPKLWTKVDTWCLWQDKWDSTREICHNSPLERQNLFLLTALIWAVLVRLCIGLFYYKTSSQDHSALLPYLPSVANPALPLEPWTVAILVIIVAATSVRTPTLAHWIQPLGPESGNFNLEFVLKVAAAVMVSRRMPTGISPQPNINKSLPQVLSPRQIILASIHTNLTGQTKYKWNKDWWWYYSSSHSTPRHAATTWQLRMETVQLWWGRPKAPPCQPRS